MNEAIEDCVGIGWIADHRVPALDGELAGDDGGAPPVAFFENLQEVMTGLCVERLESPIVEDEELDAGETPQNAGIAAITAGEREFGDRSAYRSSWHSPAFARAGS